MRQQREPGADEEGGGEGGADMRQREGEMARSFGRRPLAEFRAIVLPSLYPYVFATLRIGFGVAWKVALTAELFGGNAGLGYLFNIARQDYDTPLIFVVIVLMIAFVYLVDRQILAPLQARLGRHYAAR